MMHHNNVVLTISTEKNSVREYNFKKDNLKKSCEVILPYDTEYKINVKNGNKKRVMLEISIDGGNVTSSGLIINGNSNASIERFLDVAKKFKFVKSNNDQVSDPTSTSNGKIYIKVHLEKEIEPSIADLEKRIRDLEFEKHIYGPKPNPWGTGARWPNYPNGGGWGYNDTLILGSGAEPTYGSSGINDSIQLMSLSCSQPSSYIGALRSFDSSTAPASVSLGGKLDAGATVEGSDSKQTFTTSTWNGTSESFEFEFQVFGQKDNFNEEEYKKFLELKAKFESK